MCLYKNVMHQASNMKVDSSQALWFNQMSKVSKGLVETLDAGQEWSP